MNSNISKGVNSIEKPLTLNAGVARNPKNLVVKTAFSR